MKKPGWNRRPRKHSDVSIVDYEHIDHIGFRRVFRTLWIIYDEAFRKNGFNDF